MKSITSTIVRVGRKPAQLGALGAFFDGQSAQAHAVRLSIDETRAELVIAWGNTEVRWPLAEIRAVPDQAEQGDLVLMWPGAPLERLMTDESRIAVRCPELRKPVVKVSRWRIATWANAALASVALIILVLVPRMADQLATFIPPAGEKALGDATLERVRSSLDGTGVGQLALCDAPEGRAALDKMTARLTAGYELATPLDVHVLDQKMINAFALPGGHIVLVDGLIQAAETPEALAAVIAHEVGHVVGRDATRHALRSAGSIGVLGLLFGDFAGGALVLFLTEQLIQANYSQSAESTADSFAHEMLSKAGVSPAALGDMFEGFRKRFGDNDGIVAHFVSHPSLGDRIDAAHRAIQTDMQVRPILGDTAWQALRNICR
ncbi:M48 family metallopeptidase [Shimia abyssi]|uniref:Peptidase M48-like protein n=1 Tax=Shimia abyssi TaxID=1662395 RepID=A0A2P8EV27_9RHOB|nr:M48 family metallopeptidase [Shimia abyssi]PSL13285.1 peptidase M48-like protein [Shimia abyssi]